MRLKSEIEKIQGYAEDIAMLCSLHENADDETTDEEYLTELEVKHEIEILIQKIVIALGSIREGE